MVMKKMKLLLLTAALGGAALVFAACTTKKSSIEPNYKNAVLTSNEYELSKDESSINLNSYRMVNTSDKYIVYEMPFRYSDGRMIYGRYYIPKDGKGELIEGSDLIVMAHGFGGSYKSVEPCAKKAVEDGNSVYIFDFIGGSVESSSSGDMEEMSVLTEVRDLKFVINRLKSLNTVNPEKIFLSGVSQGGVVVAIVAKEIPLNIKGLILLSPAFNIPDDVRNKYKTKEEIPETPIMLGERLGRIYCLDVYDMDIWSEISGYDKPVLIVHGAVDKLVPISYSKKAAKIYKNSTFLEVENAGHGYFEGESGEEVGNVIHKFIELIKNNKK